MDVISDVLARMRLEGTLYFRTAFSAPWSVAVPHQRDVVRFHFAHRGACVIRIEGCPAPLRVEPGDFLLVTGGAAHVLAANERDLADAAPLETVLRDSGFAGTGALVWGGGDEHADVRQAELVCGHFAFDRGVSHPLIARLPPAVMVRDWGANSGAWMERTLQLIANETGQDRAGSDYIALRMSEIIFAQALRAFLENEGRNAPGLGGFGDPAIARALSALHADPARDWTVAALALEAGMSRTSFSNRFSERLQMTPFHYLAEWRMTLARSLLAQGNRGVAEIGERVGYASEAAFARTFKKRTGVTPAAWRKQGRAA